MFFLRSVIRYNLIYFCGWGLMFVYLYVRISNLVILFLEGIGR